MRGGVYQTINHCVPRLSLFNVIGQKTHKNFLLSPQFIHLFFIDDYYIIYMSRQIINLSICEYNPGIDSPRAK